MLYMLGDLAERGGLKSFMTLAEAVMRVDESLQCVEDKKTLTRVSQMLDHVFCQAYRGDKPMSVLAERVESILDVVDLGGQRPRVPVDPDTDPWSATRRSDRDEAPLSSLGDSGGYDGWGGGDTRRGTACDPYFPAR